MVCKYNPLTCGRERPLVCDVDWLTSVKEKAHLFYICCQKGIGPVFTSLRFLVVVIPFVPISGKYDAVVVDVIFQPIHL